MKKPCPACDYKNESTAKFCTNCGAELNEESARRGRLCPAGRHTMDPTWTHCPYCEAELHASESGQTATAQKPGTPRRNPTLVGSEADYSSAKPSGSASGRRVTLDQPGVQPEEREEKPGSSRIVAVLISYSRDKRGELFAIREGKNYIGSGNSPRGELCEICFPEDNKMSAEHALILYRGGKCFIYDEQSTNGTFLNERDIRDAELPNYALLRIGRTRFTFIKTEANGPEAAEPSQPYNPI